MSPSGPVGRGGILILVATAVLAASIALGTFRPLLA